MLTTINIDASKIGSQERKDKLAIVAQEMHRVINSTLFRDKIMQIKKQGELSKFKNQPNSLIYKHIMSGQEVLDDELDYELDIFVNNYFSLKRVIGYTKPSIKTIFVNTRYFDKRNTRDIGSNILHEYGHKLGFKHAFRKTRNRHLSLCYQLNKAYEDCYDKLFGIPQYKTICYRNWKTLWIKKTCYQVEISE